MRPWASFYLEHGNNGYKEPEILMKREPLSFSPSSTQVPQAYPSPWDCKFEGRVSKEIDRRHRTDNHTHSIIMMDQSAKSAWDIFWWWLSKPHWLHLQIRKSLTRFTYHFYETLFHQVWASGVYTPINNCKVSGKKKVFKISPFFFEKIVLNFLDIVSDRTVYTN